MGNIYYVVMENYAHYFKSIIFPVSACPGS